MKEMTFKFLCEAKENEKVGHYIVYCIIRIDKNTSLSKCISKAIELGFKVVDVEEVSGTRNYICNKKIDENIYMSEKMFFENVTDYLVKPSK